MIRIASIGYGDIARRRHFPELRNLGDKAQLVALAGRDEPSLAECAREFNVPAWYADADEMLVRDDIDAVLILTPPRQPWPICKESHRSRQARAAGKADGQVSRGSD